VIVLASTSPYRRALLDRLGLAYEVASPPYDEIAPEGMSPIDCAKLFATGKARSVLALRPGCLVIGADQALAFEGAMLRKPDGPVEACAQLLSLAGKEHQLHSAVALCGPGGEVRVRVATVTLAMRALTPAQAARYVEVDEPAGSVGGYLYEKRGVSLFESVRGSDDSAIVGLPLVELCALLREAGVSSL
jgi:septum formation protein